MRGNEGVGRTLIFAAFLSRYLLDLTADGVLEPSASSDAAEKTERDGERDERARERDGVTTRDVVAERYVPSSDTRVQMWSNRVARRRWPSDPAQVSALASRAAQPTASGSWSSAWGTRAASTPSRSSMAVSAGIGRCGITFAVGSTTLCQPSLGSLLIWRSSNADAATNGMRAFGPALTVSTPKTAK